MKSLKQIFRFGSLAGNLYTWGRNIGSLGYKVSSQNPVVSAPRRVKGFDNNVRSVFMGPNHSALITTEGELYTWGQGKFGVLGHNDNKNYTEPKRVEFFKRNKLQVKQVTMGEYHTAALTHDGDVFTWGWPGKKQNFFMNLLFQKIGALGHGDYKTRYSPTPVEYLRQFAPVKYITSGHRFMFAHNVDGELFNWGRGEYGVFGYGNNKSLLAPKKNDFFNDYLKEEKHLHIKKMRSCNNYSMALMSNGEVYSWGSNDAGQMGIKNEIGVEIYETANFPTKVVTNQIKGAEIIDFQVGEDITAFLLDNNSVYWSGMRMEYVPKRLQLPQGISKIETVGVCHRCVVVSTEEGNIYFKNNYCPAISENDSTGLKMTTVKQLFGDGKLLSLGGMYRNRWAIVAQ